MADVLKLYRGRTTVIPLDLGMNVTGDTFAAEVRATERADSTLICTLDVVITTASTGVGTITLDDSDADVTADGGWMDLLRVTGGEPVSVFDAPVRVRFVDMPTAVPA